MQVVPIEHTEEATLVMEEPQHELHNVAQEDLNYTRQLLIEAQRMAKMGNWSFEPLSNSIYWSEGMFALHGMLPVAHITPQQTIDMVVLEDRRLMMDQMTKGEANEQGLSITYRIFREDNGQVRTMFSTSEMELNAEAKVVRVFGVTEDVTEKLADEELQLIQRENREMCAAELVVANIELEFQNKEKEARAAELAIANEELVYQNRERESRANELMDANIELAFQNKEKEARAAELVIANQELIYQNGEKELRANELLVANIELAFQNQEKEDRANELVIANEELNYQNQEKESRANELLLANIELAFQNQEKEDRAAELAIANEELNYQNKEKELRANELIVTNMELKQAQFDRDNSLMILEQRVAERTKELASKNKDVTDSINYAQRIQASLLSPFSQLTTLFPQSFIFYRPRNIVSGDFYWCCERGQRKYVVVADCTGHGVPGALMSIIGNDLLNEVIISDNQQNPSDILEQLDMRLKNKMKGDHAEVRDGMDMVLCIVDKAYSELYFAGALRPLFMADTNGKMIEMVGSRHSIGGALRESFKHFDSQRMPFELGQRIYLTSDGYYSQFGGPADKKYMKSRFKDTLEAIQPYTMAEQKVLLRNALTEWAGTNEQVDDVLVVGIEL